jgi:hypothetical protein
MWPFPVGAPSYFVIFQLIHTEPGIEGGAFVLYDGPYHSHLKYMIHNRLH